MHKTLVLAALLAVSPAFAEEQAKPTPTPDKVEKQEDAAKASPAATSTPAAAPAAAATAAAAPAAAAPAAESRPYVDAAVAFLKGLAHSNRSGDAGDQGWAEAKDNAGEKVTLKIAGKEMALDLAARKSDARVIKFQKISTLRADGTVKGVTLENVQTQIGSDAHSGKATLLMSEKDGKWVVDSVEVE